VKIKEKKCRCCGALFTPRRLTTEVVCSVKCAVELAKTKREKQEKKDWNKEKKKLKEKLKTLSDYLKEFQVIFNQYIRLRDAHLPCISCKIPTGKMNAGHYRSVGHHPQLRFHEDNVHKQCEQCNSFKRGNAVEYRINLVKKIGVEKVGWLELDHPARKYTIPEIVELKVIYKDKIKALKKTQSPESFPQEERQIPRSGQLF